MSRLPLASGDVSARWLPSHQRARSLALVALVVAFVAACTLTSDDFEPQDVTPVATGGSATVAAVTAAPTGSAACEGEASCAADEEECPGGDCPASIALQRADAGPACLGRSCQDDDECLSLICRDGCCAEATCSDGVANGDETEADCGGSECPRCPDGVECSSGADCTSGSCSASGQCALPTCDDGLRNQDELGVDCGGRCALPCPAGSACAAAAECMSGVCGSGSCTLASDTQCCQAPSCSDGVLNGSEADRDCGSSDVLCARCDPGRSCEEDAQCASGVCESGRCCGGTAGDCTRCAERLSPTLDCATAPPGGAANCAAFLQCLSNSASVCTTRSAPGCTNDPGGACNHNTYGGNDGLGLQHATRVLAEAGCTP